MIYLYGASGHGKVIAEIANEHEIEIDGFIDDDISKNEYFGYPVFHEISQLRQIENLFFSIGNNTIRAKLANKYSQYKTCILIHPNANISPSSSLKLGSVVMAGVSINADVKIGAHTIINTNASIDHECILEDFVHISPNVGLAGNVKVGEGTHIGIGASVIQGISIGKWCTIGAGAVIIRDVPEGATVVGNPGRIIKR